MKFSSFVVAAVFAALTFGLWAYLNRPSTEPRWPDQINGFAFSPYHWGQDAAKGDLPTEPQIASDIQLIASKTGSIRTYSTIGSLASVPRIAAKYKLNVIQGAWVDTREQRNEEEISGVINLARKYPNITRVIVGNEAILRNDMTVAQLSAMLDRVRSSVKQPVSTAEPWHVWLEYPELAKHVDYLAVHMLPYWEGIDVDKANDYIDDKMAQLRRKFPDKRIVIGEVGWPSEGRTRENAVATEANEALFLRRFINRANHKGYDYYLMEAFDQPWKAGVEGGVGAYWGVFNADRKPKFAFVEPIVRVPAWHTLAFVSVAIAAILLGVFFVHSRTLGTRGRSFLAGIVFPTATVAVWIIYDYSQQYLTFGSVLVGAFLILGMLGVIAVLFAEAHEWAEAHWVTARRRVLKPSTAATTASLPKVSIHVPAYNEPPAMLIETLDALARLDYPNFEVLVIDNNTKDDEVWRPVQARCLELGERFRFFHVNPLAGFKAGALNFALRNTAPDAEVIAVIDSDYRVESRWLRDLVPAFQRDKLAIVQSPQDYRDDQENAFKAMCFAEYRGFFHIGMVTRNERNAIIQHGTMTLVRRTALDEVGGWAEWCITEDAELGLKLFEAGYEADYLSDSYGRGLMPDTFIDFKKQRFRWAYGAMQILRSHLSALFARRDKRLTAGQRYHFVAGWLPWLADGFNLIFNIAAIGWSIAMVVAPKKIDPPLMMFSVLPLTLFTFKLVKLIHLYVTRVGASVRQTVAAAIAGLALSHTIGLAVLKGLVTKNEPFFRTPKFAKPHALVQAFASARQETVLLVALCLGAYSITLIPQSLQGPDLSVWIAVLLIQAIPYAAAVLVSLASAFALPASLLGGKVDTKPAQPKAAPAVIEPRDL